MWFQVLKMPNPHGGIWDDLTRDQYYEMDDTNKKNYHKSMTSFMERQIERAVTPRKAGQAPPATDDQIRELREQFRFHKRQEIRLREELEKENYFSLEEEDNREMQQPRYDAVERRLNTTKEMYDNYTREEKIKYWRRLNRRFSNEELGRKASRIKERMRTNPNYTPPFEGDELREGEYWDAYIHRDVSEYNEFTNEEKRKYHARMQSRPRRRGGKGKIGGTKD